MNVNIARLDELDGLLNASYSWLGELQAGRIESLEKVVAQHNQSLMDYMQSKTLGNMARAQQEKLYQILSNQLTAIKIVNNKKQQLANKLKELRNGRNLKTTYNNISL